MALGGEPFPDGGEVGPAPDELHPYRQASRGVPREEGGVVVRPGCSQALMDKHTGLCLSRPQKPEILHRSGLLEVEPDRLTPDGV